MKQLLEQLNSTNLCEASAKRCNSCRFYHMNSNTCKNNEAFKFETSLNNTDGETVLLSTGKSSMMVPLNFGCIHHQE